MVRSYEGDRVRVNFYFDREEFDGLRKLALLSNTTYSELLRQAAREYIARHVGQVHADHSKLREFIK